MGTLDLKTKEMAALSASVAANCVPCLKYHFAEAIKEGCTLQEIQEIVEIANMVKQQPVYKINELSVQLIDELRKVK